MRTKVLITAALVAGTLFLLEYPKVYLIRGSAGGVLYWNANEALLFMTNGSEGVPMSYARYSLEPFVETLSIVRSPEDEGCSKILVIRVTDNDVQRYDTDVECVAAYDLFRGRIYAVRLPRIWEWSGTNFDPANLDNATFQAGRATTKAPVSQHPWQFDNVDGWSMRQLGSVGPKYQFNGRPVTGTQVTLNGQTVSFIFSGETFPQMPISVDLARSGQSPHTIWSFDGRPRRVSKAEYERVFPPKR
jgi:hypothetical protein